MRKSARCLHGQCGHGRKIPSQFNITGRIRIYRAKPSDPPTEASVDDTLTWNSMSFVPKGDLNFE